MKRLILTTKKRSSILIIGLLLLANLFVFGVAYNKLSHQTISNVQNPNKEQVIEAGWQVLGWGYSLLEAVRITPQG